MAGATFPSVATRPAGLTGDPRAIPLPRWEKRGRIFSREGGGFFKSHATRPIPYRLADGRLRIFFSSRCGDDMPHPAFIDVDPADPARVLAVAETPLLPLGRPGTFDDSGITPVSILRSPDGDLMYYVGWKRRRYGVTIETSIGVAEIVAGGDRLAKRFEGPILAQDPVHPLMVAAPFVVPWEHGLRMWYCSGSEWRQTPNGPEPVYSVCRADSADGIHWRADGRFVLEAAGDGEVVSAPWVVRHAGGWLMWYSHRGSESPEAKRYRIGVAASLDGEHWVRRDDEAGLDRSAEGWDSAMACYPSFYEHDGRTVMLYCGNHVGRGGIGWAVASEPFHDDGGAA
jgi:hypothetical protein